VPTIFLSLKINKKHLKMNQIKHILLGLLGTFCLMLIWGLIEPYLIDTERYALTADLICLNLAGLIAFSVQKIRPLEWWKADFAQKVRHTGLWVWLVPLSALILGMVLWWRTYDTGLIH
jgi:hypothetical protein